MKNFEGVVKECILQVDLLSFIRKRSPKKVKRRSANDSVEVIMYQQPEVRTKK